MGFTCCTRRFLIALLLLLPFATQAATVTLSGGAFVTASGTKTFTGTPAVNDLIIIFTAHTTNTSAATPTDNNTDGLGVYTEVTGAAAVKLSSADQMRVFIRNSLVGSATSTIFSHAPGATSGGGLIVFRVSGMTRTGSSAIKKSGKVDNQTAATTPTIALGSAVDTVNPVLGGVFNDSNPAALTPPSGWTEANESAYNTPTTGIETTFRSSGETGSTITWGSTSATQYCAAVVELDTSAVAVVAIGRFFPFFQP